MQRTLKALEFDKVLEHYSSFCVSNSAKQKALEIKPYLSPYGKEVNSLYHNRALFCQMQDWLEASRFEFCSFPELDGILNYLKTSHPFLDAEALWAVKQTLSSLLCVRESIEKSAHLYPVLAEFVLENAFPTELYEALAHCIGDSASLNDNASPNLLLLRNELRGHNQNCLRKVKEAIQEYNMAHYLQDDFISLDSDRYVLPLKANFKGRMQGIIHHYSNTGETVYFEPLFLVEINNRIQELKQEEREEERKVLLMLTNLMLENSTILTNAWQLFLDIDLLQAKTKLASHYNGLCIIMDSNKLDNNNTTPTPFNLPQAKHPLLAIEEAKNKNLDLRPLDIHLRESEKVLVISGGNAGGKTVCLKTTGLIIVMALAGLPVPVDTSATLPCIDNVHAFIGDEQSLDEHVSTFTGQIKHLAEAWDKLGTNSLILLDEFGAGTDPSQGVALAQAVIDGILEKNAFALSATHFPALKTYALTHEHVRAASVLFNDKTKKPLFTLAYDQVGSSSALDVAKEHGLALSIIKQAEKYLLLDGQDSTKAVDILNSLAVEREEEIAILRKEQAKASEKTKAMQAKFEEEKKKLHDEVRAKSLELMHAWKEGKATAKQSMKEMAKIRANLVTQPLEVEVKKSNNKPMQLDILKTDDFINYIPWDKKALVKEIDIKNKKIKIDLNGVSLWVSHEDVGELGNTQKEVKSIKKSNDKSSASTTQSAKEAEEMTRQRLDIRGKRADFAIIELESFLDKALLNSTDIVEIVHGKGTGALRKSVHDFLRSSIMVSHYEKANEDQGGDGMTLAYVK